jgi:hypothetical protein
MATQFQQLNDGWNADPNVPQPMVDIEQGDEISPEE